MRPRIGTLHVLQTAVTLQFAAVVALCLAGVISTNAPDAGAAFGVLSVFEMSRRVAFVHLRRFYLRRFTKLTADDISFIDGPRHLHEAEGGASEGGANEGGANEGDEAGDGEAGDGEAGDAATNAAATDKDAIPLRVGDVLFRKGGHVLSIFVLFFFHQLFKEAALIVALSGGSFLLVTLQISVLRSQHHWRIFRYLFGASDRVRDGRLAKHNAASASVALTCGVVSSYAIGQVLDVRELDLATELVILPLTFGDALGEIIGTPFGRHKFKVFGLGETNEKSVEGCVAVFAGSFVPCMVAVGLADVRPQTWALPLLVSIATTVVETISFRSTDNFTIPLANSLILLLWTRFFHLH